MYQKIFNEIKELNDENLNNLEKVNLEIEACSNLNETYSILKDFFYTKYRVSELEIYIHDNMRENYVISLKSKDRNNSVTMIKNSFNINQSSKIEFYFYFNNKKLENENELSKTLETLTYFLSKEIYTIYLSENITQLKLIDNVTGLYNRKYLSQHLEKMLPLAQRENKMFAFLHIGIDHFKAVIEEFTYEIGDELLNSLSKLLIKNVRNSDIVIKLESDEFLLVLPNINNENNALMIANKLIEEFAEFAHIINKTKNIILKKSICVGVSLFPADSKNIEEIFRHSDIALSEARNLGRSQALKFSKEISSSVDLF